MIVLESCHELFDHRPYLTTIGGAVMSIEVLPGGKYQVRRAQCGCVNRTRIVPGVGPSGDGTTTLCGQHGAQE